MERAFYFENQVRRQAGSESARHQGASRRVPEQRRAGVRTDMVQSGTETRRVLLPPVTPAASERNRQEAGRHQPERRESAGKRYRAQQRRSRRMKRLCALGIELCLCVGILAWAGKPGHLLPGREDTRNRPETGTEEWVDAGGKGYAEMDLTGYPQELRELLELNQEARDYVGSYPDRESWMDTPIDLREDFVRGQVPLLMQWDRRWGYNAYGDSMIGLAGCGPVCLTMAYLYLTEDTSMTPREMADFAYDNGYCTSAGTSWSLWTQGAEKLGLCGEELSLDERAIQCALDEGGVVVCSMRPGDFTTTGHFILIRGYDKKGFYVNDPNRRSNSERQWDFHTLQPQIKNLWMLRK